MDRLLFERQRDGIGGPRALHPASAKAHHTACRKRTYQAAALRTVFVVHRGLWKRGMCSGPITSNAGTDYIGANRATLTENISRLGTTLRENGPTLLENSPITSAKSHIP